MARVIDGKAAFEAYLTFSLRLQERSLDSDSHNPPYSLEGLALHMQAAFAQTTCDAVCEGSSVQYSGIGRFDTDDRVVTFTPVEGYGAYPPEEANLECMLRASASELDFRSLLESPADHVEKLYGLFSRAFHAATSTGVVDYPGLGTFTPRFPHYVPSADVLALIPAQDMELASAHQGLEPTSLLARLASKIRSYF